MAEICIFEGENKKITCLAQTLSQTGNTLLVEGALKALVPSLGSVHTESVCTNQIKLVLNSTCL